MKIGNKEKVMTEEKSNDNVVSINPDRMQDTLIDIYLDCTEMIGIILANNDLGEARIIWTDELQDYDNLLKLDVLGDVVRDARNSYDAAIEERDSGDL